MIGALLSFLLAFPAPDCSSGSVLAATYDLRASIDQAEALQKACSPAPASLHKLGTLDRGGIYASLKNTDKLRTISGFELKVTTYDPQRREWVDSLFINKKGVISPGADSWASIKTAHSRVPVTDKMVLFVQLERVTFSDGSQWKASTDCALSDDLQEIRCKPKD